MLLGEITNTEALWEGMLTKQVCKFKVTSSGQCAPMYLRASSSSWKDEKIRDYWHCFKVEKDYTQWSIHSQYSLPSCKGTMNHKKNPKTKKSKSKNKKHDHISFLVVIVTRILEVIFFSYQILIITIKSRKRLRIGFVLSFVKESKYVVLVILDSL